jgi:ferredoxin
MCGRRSFAAGCTVVSLLALISAAAGEAASWPQFRGPDRNGISSETGLLRQWPEGGPRVLWTLQATPVLELGERLRGFEEIAFGLTAEQASGESRRCLSCGCRKADGCGVRSLATEYRVDPYRFTGNRRRFTQDLSHAEVIYEPGKCIVCGACERIAADACPTGALAFKTARACDLDTAFLQGRRRPPVRGRPLPVLTST